PESVRRHTAAWAEPRRSRCRGSARGAGVRVSVPVTAVVTAGAGVALVVVTVDVGAGVAEGRVEQADDVDGVPAQVQRHVDRDLDGVAGQDAGRADRLALGARVRHGSTGPGQHHGTRAESDTGRLRDARHHVLLLIAERGGTGRCRAPRSTRGDAAGHGVPAGITLFEQLSPQCPPERSAGPTGIREPGTAGRPRASPSPGARRPRPAGRRRWSGCARRTSPGGPGGSRTNASADRPWATRTGTGAPRCPRPSGRASSASRWARTATAATSSPRRTRPATPTTHRPSASSAPTRRTTPASWPASITRPARRLARLLTAGGRPTLPGHWSDTVFVRLRRLMGLRTELLVLMVAEVVALRYYRALRDGTTDPLTREVAARILADEERHVPFH